MKKYKPKKLTKKEKEELQKEFPKTKGEKNERQ